MNIKKPSFVKNKKGFAMVLVTVIVLAVIFVVLLRFYAAILALLKALGEEYFGCLLRKVISAHTKVWPIGVQVWGAFCPPLVKTITLGEKGENLIPIDVSITKRELKNLEEWYPGRDFEDTEIYRQYRLDEAIAKGMKRCWGRDGQGKLPLGPEWNDKFKEVLKSEIFYCDLCAVYKFDSDVQEFFFGEELILDEFLKRNPISGIKSESYWEYLKDEDYNTDFKEIKYSTDNDLAIVYIRTNPSNLHQAVRQVLRILPVYSKKDIPTPYDSIILTPFEDFEKLGCRT